MPSAPNANTIEPADDQPDAWAQLAEHRDVLEMCVEEGVPFADRAEQLLARLEEEGYG